MDIVLVDRAEDMIEQMNDEKQKNDGIGTKRMVGDDDDDGRKGGKRKRKRKRMNSGCERCEARLYRTYEGVTCQSHSINHRFSHYRQQCYPSFLLLWLAGQLRNISFRQ